MENFKSGKYPLFDVNGNKVLDSEGEPLFAVVHQIVNVYSDQYVAVTIETAHEVLDTCFEYIDEHLDEQAVGFEDVDEKWGVDAHNAWIISTRK